MKNASSAKIKFSTNNTDTVSVIKSVKWDHLKKQVKKGNSGEGYWQTQSFEQMQLHLVEISANFESEDMFRGTHVVHCLKGKVICEVPDGTFYLIMAGMSYLHTCVETSYRIHSNNGAVIFIVEGIVSK